MKQVLKNIFVLQLLLATIPDAAEAQGLIAGSATYIVPSGNIQLTISNGSFVNDGNFTDTSGKVNFTGNAAIGSTRIGGTGISSFYDLVLNKTSGGLQLEQSILVGHVLDLQSGDSLFLNGYHIDLGTTGTLNGETEARRITGLTGGYIQATSDLNAPVAADPGHLGLQITSLANLGTTVIKRAHQQQGGRSIYRYFDISPANNSSLLATLRFSYFHAELALVSEGNLAYFSNPGSGSTWTNLGESGIDPFSNAVLLTGVNTLSRFTLSDISQPLYVKLLYFRAATSGETNLLQWATAAEYESAYFEIERSGNGIRFEPVGRIEAAGNSVQDRTYQYRDLDYPAGILYYRLKITDAAGKVTYSDIAMIRRDLGLNNHVKAWPNPAGNSTTVGIFSATTKPVTMMILDHTGHKVMQSVIHCTTGYNQITVGLEKLPEGIYILHFPDAPLQDLKLVKF